MQRFSSIQVGLVVAEHSDFGTPEVFSDTVTTKAETILALSTKSGSLMLVGTYDALMEFATEVMRTTLSWPLVSGHSDWFGDEVTFDNGGVEVHVR